MRARGITILELAVSMAVGAVVFTILGSIFIAQGRYFAIEDAIGETQYNAFQALDTVGLYALSSARVTGSREINGTNYSSGTSTLVLEIPTVDSSGEFVPVTYDYVAFSIYGPDPTRMVVDIDAGTSSALVDATRLPVSLVDKLIFRYNAVNPTEATAVDMYVRTRKDARGQTVMMPLGKTYYLGSS